MVGQSRYAGCSQCQIVPQRPGRRIERRDREIGGRRGSHQRAASGLDAPGCSRFGLEIARSFTHDQPWLTTPPIAGQRHWSGRRRTARQLGHIADGRELAVDGLLSMTFLITSSRYLQLLGLLGLSGDSGVARSQGRFFHCWAAHAYFAPSSLTVCRAR